MKLNWKKLADETISSLSPGEREESIVYLEQRLFPAGELLPWNEIAQSFGEPVVMAFVDLEPALNWTHRGRYLVLGAAGNLCLTVDVDRPPFLTGVSPHLRLIHRGSRAPSWAVVASAIEP